jgi:hypothetical protein
MKIDQKNMRNMNMTSIHLLASCIMTRCDSLHVHLTYMRSISERRRGIPRSV